jgi:hypothetical protein
MKQLFILFLLVIACNVQAQKQETIYLQDGTSVTGQVMDDDGSSIIVKTNNNYVTIKKSDIENEQNSKKREFAKRDNELKSGMSTDIAVDKTKDCCKDVEYVRYCLGKYYSQTNTAIGVSLVGLITSTAGIVLKSPATMLSGGAIVIVGEIIAFDSRKWIKRASLGANGIVVNF